LEDDCHSKIFFIGTGSALTSLKRFHTSFIISNSKTNILIDCGDGISKKLKELHFNCLNIQNILISHLHPDHFSGLASLIVQMKLQNRLEPLNIFIHKELSEFLEKFLEQIYLFKSRLTFKLKINSYDFEQVVPLNNGFNFISKKNTHLDKYSDSEKSIKFISPSYLFNIGDKKIYYSSDIGDRSDLYLFDSKVDISIIETTHIKFSDILDFVRKGFSNRYFLVHIDENKEVEIKLTFRNEIADRKVFIPNDGDEYSI
jgi:ribonuclease BN (tRNA processing enzyme)